MSMSASGNDVVRPEIVEIFADVFQHDGAIDRATSQETVERWDSLQHIALISRLERAFGITLTMDEMMEIRSVGDIEAVLDRHGV